MFQSARASLPKRVDYNARIVDILHDRLGIDLDQSHPRFSEIILSVAGLIGEGWYTNSSPEAAALEIAFRYMVDKLDAGEPERVEARNLAHPVLAFLAEATAAGKIPDADAREMLRYHNEHSWRLREATDAVEDHCRAL
jgi:hypothetical protein